MERNNGIPLYAEERRIETNEETIAELREQLRKLKAENEELKNELEEIEEEYDEMTLKALEKAEENGELRVKVSSLKIKLLGSLFKDKKIEKEKYEKRLSNLRIQVFNGNKQITNLKEKLKNETNKKDKEINDLKDELEQKKQKSTNLQTELNKELSWWDKWINHPIYYKETKMDQGKDSVGIGMWGLEGSWNSYYEYPMRVNYKELSCHSKESDWDISSSSENIKSRRKLFKKSIYEYFREK